MMCATTTKGGVTMPSSYIYEVTLAGRWSRTNTYPYQVREYRSTFRRKAHKQPFTLLELTSTLNPPTDMWGTPTASGTFAMQMDVRATSAEVAIRTAKRMFTRHLNYIMCRLPEIEYI